MVEEGFQKTGSFFGDTKDQVSKQIDDWYITYELINVKSVAHHGKGQISYVPE